MKLLTLIAAFVVAVSLSVPAFADDLAQAIAGPQQPQGAIKLQALVGHWTGLGEMKMADQAPMTVTIVFNCVSAAGGWALRCDDVMTGRDTNYLEEDLMGYDAAAHRVHWYAVTNAGEVQDQVGEWKDDNTLVVNYTGTQGDKASSEDVVLHLTSANEMTAKSVVTIGGIVSQSMKMSLKKSGGGKNENPFKEK